VIGTQSWNPPRDKILNRSEVGRILAAAKRDQRDYVFLVVSSNVGLRICEVVHLEVDNLRKEQLVITRRKKKSLQKEIIDLSPPVAELLRTWVGRRKTGWMWPGDSEPCILVRTREGKESARETLCAGGHVSRRSIQRRWDEYAEKAGLSLEGRGIHTLRHYAITTFYETHRDLRATQMFAGHSSSAITERYAHIVDMKEKIAKVKPVF